MNFYNTKPAPNKGSCKLMMCEKNKWFAYCLGVVQGHLHLSRYRYAPGIQQLFPLHLKHFKKISVKWTYCFTTCGSQARIWHRTQANLHHNVSLFERWFPFSFLPPTLGSLQNVYAKVKGLGIQAFWPLWFVFIANWRKNKHTPRRYKNKTSWNIGIICCVHVFKEHIVAWGTQRSSLRKFYFPMIYLQTL